jgi:hypothetical protein
LGSNIKRLRSSLEEARDRFGCLTAEEQSLLDYESVHLVGFAPSFTTTAHHSVKGDAVATEIATHAGLANIDGVHLLGLPDLLEFPVSTRACAPLPVDVTPVLRPPHQEGFSSWQILGLAGLAVVIALIVKKWRDCVCGCWQVLALQYGYVLASIEA